MQVYRICRTLFAAPWALLSSFHGLESVAPLALESSNREAAGAHGLARADDSPSSPPCPPPEATAGAYATRGRRSGTLPTPYRASCQRSFQTNAVCRTLTSVARTGEPGQPGSTPCATDGHHSGPQPQRPETLPAGSPNAAAPDGGQQSQQQASQPMASEGRGPYQEAPPAAAAVLAPLLEGRPFVVAQLPGRGRGLVASRAIAAGELLHEERPLLAFPALEAAHQVCYHCLAAMPLGAGVVRHRGSGRRFCCDACLRAALRSYLAVETAAAEAAATAAAALPAPSGLDSAGSAVAQRPPLRGVIAGGGGSPLDELYEDCRRYGERFPLMAARLAFMRVSEAVRQHLTTAIGATTYSGAAEGPQSHPGSTTCLPSARLNSAPMSSPALTHAADAADGGTMTHVVHAGGDPLRSFHVLCYARLTPPYPDPWVAQHGQLLSALQALQGDAAALRRLVSELGVAPEGCGMPGEDITSGELQTLMDMDSLAAVVGAAVDGLTLEWYVGVLARLHLNVFQVHNPLAGGDPSDLAAVASALVAGTAGGASAGSAAYLLASLFNHSCDPSLDLSFPHMDGAAAFTAARDIDAGEELTVSYLDVGLPYATRRQHLEWSYGFMCGCARCKEEAAEQG